jgi:hypothetical protein
MSYYKINPVNAAIKAHENGDCDIHELNDTCYGVCAAFQGGDSAWTVGGKCAEQCEELIEWKRKAQYGKSYCDHQRPSRPVIWDQSPHYFPEIYKKVRNVPKALAECNAKCCGEKLPNQCKQNCRIDSYAVDDPQATMTEGYRHGRRYHHRRHHHYRRPDYAGYEKANPAAFWIGYGVALILFMIVVVMAIRAISQR